MPYKPFVFGKSNNKIIINNSPADNNPFCDLSYIESKFKEGYKDIFVVNSYGELLFRGQAQKAILAEKAEIDGDSGDLYDRPKNLLHRASKKIAYLHHFILK